MRHFDAHIDHRLPEDVEPCIEEVEVYCDESGNTGEDLLETQQGNLFLAAMVVPPAIRDAFWRNASRAWYVAAGYLGCAVTSVELKGVNLYGGKGPFHRLSGRKRIEILEIIFTALAEHRIHAFWEGVPKHRFAAERQRLGMIPKELPIWKSVLATYCDELYDLVCALYPHEWFCVTGDENSWVEAGRALKHPRWDRVAGDGVQFLPSSQVPGLQIADILVHTLYRANRTELPPPGAPLAALSNTDRTAQLLRARLADAGLWVNISTALQRLGSY